MAFRRSGESRQLDLAELAIRLHSISPGEHRAPCPHCARAKYRAGDDALAVRIDTDGSAVWVCHRCDWKGTTRAARGSWSDGGPDRGERLPVSPDPPPRPLEPPHRPFPDDAARAWDKALAISTGCIVANYLEGRGCCLPPPDGDLRWDPAQRHPCGYVGPALIALVTDAITGERMTLHRTWLAADGSGKAPIDKPRLLWPGRGKKGGVIRLWPDGEVILGLTIAEGIETALTVAHATPPVWAVVDAGNMAAFPALPGIESLLIVADHDHIDPRTGKSRGLDAAAECAIRWFTAGAEVRLWHHPEPGKDFNDLTLETAA